MLSNIFLFPIKFASQQEIISIFVGFTIREWLIVQEKEAIDQKDFDETGGG
jgi:hypothetical protein